MQRKTLRVAQSTLLLITAVTGCVLGYERWSANQLFRFDWHHLPKEGYAFHDTHGYVPGNPENGVQGLKRLYSAIQIFRSNHNGNYPASSSALIDDCIRDPGRYGVSDWKAFMDSFYNPDNRYGDGSFRKPDKMMMVSVVGIRPDGKPVGGPKPAGTRDLIGISDLYYHENSRIYSESHGTVNPVGVYLLLWDDGTVEKLPYHQRMYVKIAPEAWKAAFPGQAGLPKKGVSTYDEWYKSQGWKAGPRGVPGGSGLDGRTYNPKSGG